MMGGFGYGGMLFGGLMMLVFWVLVILGAIWLVVTLVRSSVTPAVRNTAVQTPLEILKIRYAKGEVTKEQFEQMKQDLST